MYNLSKVKPISSLSNTTPARQLDLIEIYFKINFKLVFHRSYEAEKFWLAKAEIINILI